MNLDHLSADLLFPVLHEALVHGRTADAADLLERGLAWVNTQAPQQLPQLWHYSQLAAQAFSPEPPVLALPPLATSPLVSVITPTVGGRDGLLRDAIDSVRAQTYQNWQLIVVNARDCDLPWTPRFPAQERLINPRRSLIAAQARNIGIEQAQGDLIAFLDDDDLWHPGFLAQACEVLRTGQLAGAFGNCELVEEEIGGASRRVHRRHPPAFGREFSAGLLSVRNYIVPTELIYRRDAVAALRFCEEMVVWEDWEYLQSVIECGPLGRLAGVTGEHRRRITGGAHVSHTHTDIDRHFDLIYDRHPAANSVIAAARRVYRQVQGGGAPAP